MKCMILESVVFIALGMGTVWAAAADGKATYDAKCKSCHGADGKGTPAMVKAMGVKPINGVSEADTKAAILKGKNKMKPIPGMTGKTLDDVAAYVASLK
jgi:mono/diheme cytochrome c family protein